MASALVLAVMTHGHQSHPRAAQSGTGPSRRGKCPPCLHRRRKQWRGCSTSLSDNDMTRRGGSCCECAGADIFGSPANPPNPYPTRNTSVLWDGPCNTEVGYRVSQTVLPLQGFTRSPFRFDSACNLAPFSCSTTLDRSFCSLSLIACYLTGSIWRARHCFAIEIADSEPNNETAPRTPIRSRILTATNAYRHQHKPPPQTNLYQRKSVVPTTVRTSRPPASPPRSPRTKRPAPPPFPPPPAAPPRHRAPPRRARRAQIL